MRFLPTRTHGIIDYVWGLALIAAPLVLGQPIGGAASWGALAFGVGAIVYSLLTDYEVGLVPLIPMPLHLALDAVAGVALAALPFVLGFEGGIGPVFVAFGLFALAASLVTRTQPLASPLRS